MWTICNQLCQTQLKLERPFREKVYKNLRLDGEKIEENKDKRQMIQNTNMCRLLYFPLYLGISGYDQHV